ncbi:3-oxoacyl-[acyl-carrier-protein] synthase III C-terminal domain-containing protein [Ponticoccus litoralis]|uniref:3-oxoacyl-[acyl-carrier-protein] synthase III C-terminal domain-containing protein n=1 Tax=Ponticoccus litoralis TaxID=422297 RepID=A0AAW9S7R1_9RHOB
MVSAHILGHLGEEGWQADDLKRLWLHQANKTMNDFIGKKVLGREPEAGEQPNILQDYANTSSSRVDHRLLTELSGPRTGRPGVICSFGAGYSVGSVLVQRA